MNLAKSKLKDIIKEKEISLLEISKETGLAYSTIHSMFNKDYLDDTRLGSLIKVGKIINIDIQDMFEIIGGTNESNKSR